MPHGNLGSPENHAQNSVSAIFDEQSDSYNDAVNKALVIPGFDVDYFTRVKAGYILDRIRQHFQFNQKLDVIDLGCGVGNYHPLIVNSVGSLSGIDVSKSSIEVASQKNPKVSYRSYDGGRMPFSDGLFDLAFTICVVHHVPTPQWQLFMQDAWRILKPNGLFLIFEHNPKNPLTMRVVNKCPFDADAVLLTQKTAKNMLVEAGFENVSSHTILNIPSFGPYSRKIDTLIGKLPFGAQYIASGIKI